MVELPEFRVLRRQPKVPHVARVVAHRDVENEYGTPITYTVMEGRNHRDWWIAASLNGMRMSDTLHTTKRSVADEWIRAVDRGDVCIACNTTKSEAQLDAEIEESFARKRSAR